jgi:PTS system mannitol-specific IIA component
MSTEILALKNIKLNMKFNDKIEAILYAGQILVDHGHVEEGYLAKMLERESLSTTYIGNGIAIPHGTKDALGLVKAAGVSIIQVPKGIDFGGGNIAYMVIGLAANGDDHLDILTSIAVICSEDENVERLKRAVSEQEIIDIFAEGMES